MKTITLFYTNPTPLNNNDSFNYLNGVDVIRFMDLTKETIAFQTVLDTIESDYLAFVDPQINGADELLSEVVLLLQNRSVKALYSKNVVFATESKFFLPTPYFFVVQKDVFCQWFEEILTYKTLTYAFIHLGIRLKESGSKIELLKSLVTDNWIINQLHDYIDDFSTDYSKLKNANCFHETAVPPQFRITTADQIVDIKKILTTADKQPLFSIICPVFKPTFVKEMIQSVIGQQWERWELLLGVDGPILKDEQRILETITSFSDKRITYFVQKNQGTGPTRETLRKRASGDFIVSIDDDDKLTPFTLEVFAKAIAKSPTIKSFRGGSQIFGLVAQKLIPKHRYQINGISNDLFEVNQPYTIERNLLEQIGGYHWDKDLYNAGEDTYLFHELDKLKVTTGLIQLPLYFRRLSTENLTLKFEGEEAMAHFDNLDRKFGKSDWTISYRKFDFEGNFQRYHAVYENKGQKVFLATKFFQYQTLGDLKHLTIDLEVTSRCNAVCGFCPRDAMPDTSTHVSLEVVHNIANFVRQFPGTQVVLCGIGESLLHPNIVEIVSILKEAGALVSMTSNGALMRLKKFQALVEAGLTNFNFSINANSAEVHQEVMGMKNYVKVVKNITALLDYKAIHYPSVRVHASCVVCEQNENEVDDFICFWKSKGVTQVWLHPTNNRAGLLGAGLKSGKINFFAEIYKDDPDVSVDIFRDHEEGEKLCKIAKALAFISSKGNMHLCAMDYKRQIIHGNIKHKTMQQMQFEKLKNCMNGTYDDFCVGCDFCPSGIKKSVADANKLVVL